MVYYKTRLQCSSYNQPPKSAGVHSPVSKESLWIKLAIFELGTCSNFFKSSRRSRDGSYWKAKKRLPFSLSRIKETGRTKRVPTTRGVPRPSPIQVLTAPDVALLARSDGFACIQRGMVVGGRNAYVARSTVCLNTRVKRKHQALS